MLILVSVIINLVDCVNKALVLFSFQTEDVFSIQQKNGGPFYRSDGTVLSMVILKMSVLNNPEIKIIDIQSEGVEQFVIDILSCENILSSSLHGLILAEAYGIPTCRVVFSEKILGGDFKFYDYYSGVGIHQMETFNIHDDISDFYTASKNCSLKDLKFNPTALKNSLIDYISTND